MVKRACMSNCRDPENRSKKSCVCGGHSTGARKRRRPWRVVPELSTEELDDIAWLRAPLTAEEQAAVDDDSRGEPW